MSFENNFHFIGGKEVISRLLKAYGFSNRRLLAEHLEMPHSTFGTWASRGFFPAELVIRGALETGARLEYLALGKEPVFNDESDLKSFECIKLDGGKLIEMPPTSFTLPHLPPDTDPDKTLCVIDGDRTFFVAVEFGDLIDGEYLVVVENSAWIRQLTLMPGKQVHIAGGNFDFDTAVENIKVLGKVILKMERV
ncbi:phage repressor protein CI [Pasteurellaceae bacterium HPA106]|uniref:helix-turn-helix transcriptional regulator n=1 Tax=Spirabiliibacterium pneumoniae TaxID=221400 RepID=UPI001AAD7A83|nr:helix-turn-helix transcriptional regulator [Spirabiliibacterium pneumoniae]MBE2895597.1 phage repressor protein CI [Spirabiliibacterium pneumoniae]